jgi:chemotaxis family two-component system sensor kinase Cph1
MEPEGLSLLNGGHAVDTMQALASVFQGRPDLMWLMVVSDAFIVAAYFMIPMTLAVVIRRVRVTLHYNWAISLFAGFILLCGVAHAIEIIVFWQPIYGIQAWEKALTAAVSIMTAFLIKPLVPRLTEMRTPEELTVANSRLEAEAQRRETAEAELRHTVANLNRALEELEQFAYITSHDLQAPLRSISGFSQLLQRRYRQKFDGDALEFLDYIDKGTRQMQNLIEDMLALSRIGRSRDARFEAQPLQQTVDTVLHTLRPAIEATGARIDCAPLPTVVADHNLLAQLFQNLISNSLKFHRPGDPPHIHISAESDADQIHIEIRDNGIGIPEEQLENIFVMFRRLHKAEAYEGTGIGLAICRKIAAHHGGDISATSDSTGTQFHLRLPVAPKAPFVSAVGPSTARLVGLVGM